MKQKILDIIDELKTKYTNYEHKNYSKEIIDFFSSHYIVRESYLPDAKKYERCNY